MLLKKPKFWDQTSNSLLSLTLLPISWLVLFFNKLKKLKKKIKFSTKVICVGNIYIGGTGKTPLAIEICKILLKINKKPAFIKKNYKYVSDEIKLLGKTARVFTDKNRSISIKNSIKDGYNTVILDDGFQDYKIKKNLSIICFNSNFEGNSFVIPAGPLRENLSSIKNAQIIEIDQKNIKPENKSDKLYLNRIRNLMGSEFSDEAIKIENSKQITDTKFAKIDGFIGLTSFNKSNYHQQHLFVNGR